MRTPREIHSGRLTGSVQSTCAAERVSSAEEARAKMPSSKEAWPFYKAISGVRLCWELEEPKGPQGQGHRSKVGSKLFLPGRRHAVTLHVSTWVVGSGYRVSGFGFRV